MGLVHHLHFFSSLQSYQIHHTPSLARTMSQAPRSKSDWGFLRSKLTAKNARRKFFSALFSDIPASTMRAFLQKVKDANVWDEQTFLERVRQAHNFAWRNLYPLDKILVLEDFGAKVYDGVLENVTTTTGSLTSNNQARIDTFAHVLRQFLQDPKDPDKLRGAGAGAVAQLLFYRVVEAIFEDLNADDKLKLLRPYKDIVAAHDRVRVRDSDPLLWLQSAAYESQYALPLPVILPPPPPDPRAITEHARALSIADEYENHNIPDMKVLKWLLREVGLRPTLNDMLQLSEWYASADPNLDPTLDSDPEKRAFLQMLVHYDPARIEELSVLYYDRYSDSVIVDMLLLKGVPIPAEIFEQLPCGGEDTDVKEICALLASQMLNGEEGGAQRARSHIPREAMDAYIGALDKHTPTGRRLFIDESTPWPDRPDECTRRHGTRLAPGRDGLKRLAQLRHELALFGKDTKTLEEICREHTMYDALRQALGARGRKRVKVDPGRRAKRPNKGL